MLDFTIMGGSSSMPLLRAVEMPGRHHVAAEYRVAWGEIAKMKAKAYLNRGEEEDLKDFADAIFTTHEFRETFKRIVLEDEHIWDMGEAAE